MINFYAQNYSEDYMKNVGYLLLLAILFLSDNAFADEGRRQLYFISENGKYIFRSLSIEDKNTVKHPVWEVYEIQSQKQLYTIKEDFKTWNVSISNDGQTVVAVNDYVQGLPADSIILMKFYYQGILKREMTMGALVQDNCNVTESIAHFRWCFDDSELRSDGIFATTTFELIRYEFDSKNGETVNKVQHPALTESSLYLCGHIKLIKPGEYEIVPWRIIYGEKSLSPIRFHSQSANIPQEGCIIIDNGIYSENQPMPYALEHCR